MTPYSCASVLVYYAYRPASLSGERKNGVPTVSDKAQILRLPYRGASQTIWAMKKAALEESYPVRLLAEQICDGVKSKDYLSEYAALYFFVCSRTRYARDPRKVELVRSPAVVVDQLLAGRTPNLDCDDMSAFLGCMLLMMGAETRFATLAFSSMFYRGQRQYSHVCVQAKEPRSGAWITLDPVAGPRTPDMLKRCVAAAYWPLA